MARQCSSALDLSGYGPLHQARRLLPQPPTAPTDHSRPCRAWSRPEDLVRVAPHPPCQGQDLAHVMPSPWPWAEDLRVTPSLPCLAQDLVHVMSSPWPSAEDLMQVIPSLCCWLPQRTLQGGQLSQALMSNLQALRRPDCLEPLATAHLAPQSVHKDPAP